MKTLAGGPKTQAHAVRIWAYCNKRNWDVSRQQISDDLKIPLGSVNVVMSKNGWGGRINEKRRYAIVQHAHHAQGHRANINLIPLDILIRG